MIDKIIKEMAETAVNASRKSLCSLTEHEKLCIAIASGCATEFSETGIRLKNPVSFIEIDGSIIIHERV